MMKIPIIILNYNSSSDCKKCIGFLKRQQGVEIEIVVVDNCSANEDLEKLRSICTSEQCTLIENHENRGYNAGNNIGLRYAAEKGYKYAMIANPDMEFPQTDYLQKLIEPMEKDDDIAVVGSDIISPEGVHQNPQREVSYIEELLWFITIPYHILTKKWFVTDYHNNCFCEKISGCCFLLRMDFIKNIGFFDESVFLYSEESILGKQVSSAGKLIYYLTNTQAIHRHIKSQKGNYRKRLRTMFISREYYFKTYSGYHGLKLWLLILSKRLQRCLY